MTNQHTWIFEIVLGICCYLISCSSAEGDAIGRRTENSPPEIIDHPDDQTVPKDSPTTLICRADGYPEPVISWYKDGELLNTEQGHYSKYSNGNLFIVNVEVRRSHSDDGVYQCVAENRYGVARSNNATLIVAYMKDDFRVEPSNTDGVVGAPLVLECQPPKSNPNPVITWEKNGRVIQLDNERVRILPDGNLMISPVVPSDEGSYRCVATIEVIGSRSSSSAKVDIHESPTIVTEPEDITALPGEAVTVDCTAQGDPPPSISWQKKGGTLPEGRHSIHSTSLVIRNTVWEDSGTYICTAENIWGSVRTEAEIAIDASPRFTVRPKDQTIREGDDIEVPCQANGSPPPALMWKKEDGEHYIFPGESIGNLEISMSSSLIIQNADASNEGTYVCSTFSEMGTMDSPMMLRVISNQYSLPPLIQHGPSNQMLSVGDRAVLACISGVSLGSEGSEVIISWLKDDRPVDISSERFFQDEEGTLEIFPLETQDGGVYTCVVTNDVGKTTKSAKVQVIRDVDSGTFTAQRHPSLEDLPVAPGIPELLNQTAGTVTLGWDINNILDRNYEIYEYSVEGIYTEDPSESWQTFGRSETNRIDLHNLQTGLQMMFVVRAKNDKGFGPPSPISHPVIALVPPIGVESITSDQEPGLEEPPIDLPWVYISVATPLSATTIQVMWREDQSGTVAEGFKIRYKESATSGQWLTEMVSDSNSIILKGLESNTEYDIRVNAFKGEHDGHESNEVKVRTFDENRDHVRVPGDESVLQTKLNECGISIKKIEVLTSTDIKVSWQLERNAHYIGGFYVKLKTMKSPDQVITTRETDRFEVIHNLKPWTVYTISVQPFAGVLKGLETEPALIQTAESAPQAPPEVILFQAFNATTFKVQWNPPPMEEVPGVILGYRIFCRNTPSNQQSNVTIPGNDTFVGLIGDLVPGLSYGVKVAAFTVAGMGPFSATKFATLPQATNGPTNREDGGSSNVDIGSSETFLGHPAFFALFGLLFLLLISSCILMMWRRRRRRKHTHSVNSDKENTTKDSCHTLDHVAVTKGHPACCSCDGSSSSSGTLEKAPPPPNPLPNWPENKIPSHWLHEAYDPPQFNVNMNHPNKTYLRQNSLTSSGIGSSNYPTLSTFHGAQVGVNSPEYAVVENPDGTTTPVPGITYGPPIVHPNFLPVESLSGHHPHSVHNPMEDPEPYASSTLVLPSFRKPQFSDSSSDWTNSWNSQEHRKKTERKSHFDQGRKDSRDEGRGSLGGGPPIPRRDHSVSDHSSLYSSASSQGGVHRLPHRHHLRKDNRSPANWSDLMPPPPEQSPSDANALFSLAVQPRPSQSTMDGQQQHLAQHTQMVNIHHNPTMNHQNSEYPTINNMGLSIHDHSLVDQQHQIGNYPSNYNNQLEQQIGFNMPHRTPQPLCNYNFDGTFPPSNQGFHSLEQQDCCEHCPDCKSTKAMQTHGGTFHGEHRRNQSPRTVQNGAHDTRTYPGPVHGDHFQMAPMGYQTSSPRMLKKSVLEGEPPYARMKSGSSINHYSGGSSGSSIASQKVFADPQHAQIGQELLKYMSQEELQALAGKEVGYAAMKPSQLASKNGTEVKRRSAVSDSEIDDGTRETDFELVSNGRLSASCASLTSCNTSQCNSDCSGSEGSLIAGMNINSVLSNMEKKSDEASQNGVLLSTPTNTPKVCKKPNGATMVSRFDGTKVKPVLFQPQPENRQRIKSKTTGKQEDVV